MSAERHLKADADEMRRALKLLRTDGAVYEMRALGTDKATVSGYFDNSDRMVASAIECSNRLHADGVYLTLNPVNRALLARASNRHEEYAKHTSADRDITARYWLPLDFDPHRPAGISSTDAEHEAALKLALAVRKMLAGLGWAAPIFADSGNGAHLLYRIDLPNDDASRELVRQVLAWVDSLASDESVVVDKTTYNAARIWKFYGTIARKGDFTLDRPHRLARILDVPERLQLVTPDQLNKIAQMHPRLVPAARSNSTPNSNFSLESWISKCGIEVARESTWRGGQSWILEHCVFNKSHGGTSAAILRLVSGAIVYRCLHNGCASRTWQEVRELFDPSYRDQRVVFEAASGNSDVQRLAELPPFEYDKIRKKEAKRLGVRSDTLDSEVGNARKLHQAKNPEPRRMPQWAPPSQVHPESVDGLELIDELVDAIRHFVMLSEDDAVIAALWILFSWDFGCGAETNPFLWVISATPGCGKSTLFKVLRRLVRSGWLVARLSQSAFTRGMDEHKRTLLLDEGDAYLNSNETMRNVLDGASDPDTANVSLSVKIGDNWKPIELNVFVPIAIASIGPLRRMETVEDRSIAIHLKRATAAELRPLSKGRRRELKAMLEPVAAKCARWTADNPPDTEIRPLIPDMTGREMDKWESLISIADRIGGGWPSRARLIAVVKSNARGDDDKSLGVILLNDIHAIFETRNQDRLSSADTCSALAEMEERTWAEYGRSRRPITPSQVARLFKAFGIAPRNIRLDAVLKGYYSADFAEVWIRYGVSTSSQNFAATPLQQKGENECSGVAANSHPGVTKEIF